MNTTLRGQILKYINTTLLIINVPEVEKCHGKFSEVIYFQ